MTVTRTCGFGLPKSSRRRQQSWGLFFPARLHSERDVVALGIAEAPKSLPILGVLGGTVPGLSVSLQNLLSHPHCCNPPGLSLWIVLIPCGGRPSSTLEQGPPAEPR